MATADQHYAEAELLLEQAVALENLTHPVFYAKDAMAHVHATLAVAGASGFYDVEDGLGDGIPPIRTAKLTGDHL